MILPRFKTETPEDGSVIRARACADSLQHSAGAVGCRGLERADAAVARRA